MTQAGAPRPGRLLGQYSSFITALFYHRRAKRPAKGRFYFCVPEPSNRHDVCAIGVYDQDMVRMGYVPKSLAAKLRPLFDDGAVMLASPVRRSGSRTCGAMFLVWSLADDTIRWTEHSICGICMDDAVSVTFYPCGHRTCCLQCTGSIEPKQCPHCRQAIMAMKAT